MHLPTKFRLLYLAPVLALIALSGWALASPIGASPDDDFHLVSIWCGEGVRADFCEPGSAPNTRVVPEALVNASACYAHRPDVSAACQDTAFTLSPEPTVETKRGNFVGAYPPMYYAVMGVFATPDILGSVVAMRMLNALLFVGLVTALFALLPRERRPSLIWGWLVTTVPLGLFLIASNNPSSWAITGVGVAWIALLGYFESLGKRRIALGSIFVAATLMAAGSRGDSALYVGLAIAVVLVLTFRREKRFARLAILPTIMGATAGLLFLSARQIQSGVSGFGGAADAVATGSGVVTPTDPLSLIFANLLNIPSLWAGVLGYWGLGWIDTDMPAVVTFGAIACFVAVVFAGLSLMWWRKAFVLASVGFVLVALPTWVLYRGGDSVGQEVQPRYFLPLIVLFAGVAILGFGLRNIRFTPIQITLLVGTLAIAQLLSLYVNMRRYIQGGTGGWNLDQNPEWWWNIAVSPMFVLIISSAAFSALVWILVREVSTPHVVGSQASTVEA